MPSNLPIYALDAVVLGVILISAVLAAVRGATREVLAIVSWAVAGAAAYFLRDIAKPYALNFIPNEIIAEVAGIATVFLVTLLIVSFITVKISDMVLDSRVGAVDRALGFIFGVLRGALLCIVGWALVSWVIEGQNHKWATEAKTYPLLESTSTSFKNMFPDDFLKKIKSIKLSGIDSSSEAPEDSENAQRPAENQSAPKR